MKKMALILSASLAIATLVGCGGGSDTQTAPITKKTASVLDDLMKQKNKLLEDGIVAEIGIKKSQDLSMAINMAEQDARAKMGRALTAKVASVTKQFNEEVNDEFLEHTSQVNKTVSSEMLRGTTVITQKYETLDNGKIQAYVLMVMEPEAFKSALDAQMQANENMKTRWMASKAQEDLIKEVEAYEAFKKENTPQM